MFFAIKVIVSALLIATISTVSKKYPGLGGLIASLPLVSVLGMIWLWLEKPDAVNMADHVQSTFWFVLPSLAMFLVIPAMMRRGVAFWPSLAVGCALTIGLYSLTLWAAPRLGLRL